MPAFAVHDLESAPAATTGYLQVRMMGLRSYLAFDGDRETAVSIIDRLFAGQALVPRLRGLRKPTGGVGYKV